MTEINNLNIPAYQRKRSLAAKARKSTVKIQKNRTIKPKKITRTRHEKVDEIFLSETLCENKFENPIDIFKLTSSKTPGIREMKNCGHCDGYFDKIDVAVVKLTTSLRVGDKVIFEKDEGLFEQEITSMQIMRQNVQIAYAGDDIGLKVAMKPKVGTYVYKEIT